MPTHVPFTDPDKYSSLPILWLPNLNIGLCSALVIGDIDNNKIASEIKFKGSEKLGSEAISLEGMFCHVCICEEKISYYKGGALALACNLGGRERRRKRATTIE
ncbi:hypothetical protein HKD37_02G003118 [Glycine soja]